MYQTDAYGRIQHNKPSYSVEENGRIVEVDPYGNKQHYEQQYIIRKVRVYETNSCDRTHYHKPSCNVGTAGWSSRLTPTATSDTTSRRKVYETDAYGQVRQQKFEIKKEQGRSE